MSDFSLPYSIGGIKIIVSPDRAGYVLPADLPLPDDFRAQFNAWAFLFFKRWNPVPDGEAMHDCRSDTMVMNPRTFQALKESL